MSELEVLEPKMTRTKWTLEKRREFLTLPIAERRRLLEEMAEKAASYYEDPERTKERELWQGGDIIEYR